MSREILLQQLHTYHERFPKETLMVERFIDFVESEPRCFERDCWRGHVTGSAWLVDPTENFLLLTHHKKLDMWLQLGGHSDGDPNTPQVALREAQEESGCDVVLVSADILDVDIHEIPARKEEPAHFHFDVRYILQSQQHDFVVGDESMALAWAPIYDLERYTTEHSILRMRDKWLAAANPLPR